jgi:hypothetical protein
LSETRARDTRLSLSSCRIHSTTRFQLTMFWATTLRAPAFMSELRVASQPSCPSHRRLGHLGELSVTDTRRVSTVAVLRQLQSAKVDVGPCRRGVCSQNPRMDFSCCDAFAAYFPRPSTEIVRHSVRNEPRRSGLACHSPSARSTCCEVWSIAPVTLYAASRDCHSLVTPV